MATLHRTSLPRKKALLVAVQLPRVSDQATQESLKELGRLVDTLGYEVVGSLSQKRQAVGGGTVLGEGKLRQLALWTNGPGFVQSPVQVKKHKAALRFDGGDVSLDDGVDAESDVETETADSTDGGADGGDRNEDELGESESGAPPDGVRADVVVFDCELSPSQLRNLESATGATVLDRTGVIIEIFARHARTRAAQLQVEIARLSYVAPRLRETGGSADRQGGGIGAKGAGETAHELDRRRIRDRIKELRTELESVQHEHSVRRTRRASENAVALVGYTNAGKSSLMRAMTQSEVYVADRLFATLDTTVRPMYPETTPRILLSDTVGFIKQLPHDLVASFRSTLDEAAGADLLLFVVDASDVTFRDQLLVTQTVLHEIGVTETPSRLVLNKRDQLTEAEQNALQAEYPEAILLSTRDQNDLARLRVWLMDFFTHSLDVAEIFVPYATRGAIGEIREKMRVESENFDEAGTRFRVRSAPEYLARLQSRFGVEIRTLSKGIAAAATTEVDRSEKE